MEEQGTRYQDERGRGTREKRATSKVTSGIILIRKLSYIFGGRRENRHELQGRMIREQALRYTHYQKHQYHQSYKEEGVRDRVTPFVTTITIILFYCPR